MESGGGWQGASESAVSAKRSCSMFGAKPALPKHPSEPRLSGVHPEEDEVGKAAKPPLLTSLGVL